MNIRQVYKRLPGRSRLLFTAGFITMFFLVGVLLTQVVKGDDASELPPPSGPLLDAKAFATNVAIGDAVEQQDQQVMQDAQNGKRGIAQPKDGSFTPSNIPLYSDSPSLIGIIDHPVPLTGWGTKYHVTNGWQGIVNNAQTSIVAGSKADDLAGGVWNTPEQGMVAVLVSGVGFDGDYLAPTRSGPVRVTSYDGTCLLLTSITSSTTYIFNVVTRTWNCIPPLSFNPPPINTPLVVIPTIPVPGIPTSTP